MQWVDEGAVLQATFSQLRRKDGDAPSRTTIRPIRLKDQLYYQFEYHYANKATHENVAEAEAGARMADWLESQYRQALIKTRDADYQLLFSKKGKAAVLRKPATGAAVEAKEHNRRKNRVIAEGAPAPFLVELGIMTAEGKVKDSRMDKYRQINRFLEMVSDVLPHLPQDRPITVIDFGCGKSYLTFALYHLLAVEKGYDLNVIGLDLKADVIAFCQSLADKLGYDRLRFMVGDIAQYDESASADMVVTLHACDTATDAALAKAVGWGAKVILSVPCCQHELFRQIENEALRPLLGHGLLKERFAALATDAARGSLLESVGYKVQMLEFIDPEHTPKNLLIRAVAASSSEAARLRKWEEYVRYRDMLSVQPYLEKALAERLPFPERAGER
ncbi:class I SAM-dependent methyltransferase [Paenibacillus sp. MMS18-CY102]|uniref:class I SAM-dependent methyltransferase n=1 Tax=Paenibacillus sp. MMS18-CY102 TaxID=2682849 RepID=UPI0013657500|nr:SAM-dependent methyltransferase [Paenibacillus sp. MMS18-CY102]MWC30066.1 methyltransferase [Paenibacillus sp. MMS18-CY102]